MADVEFEAQIKKVNHTLKEEKDEEGNVISRYIETQVVLVTLDDIRDIADLQTRYDIKVALNAKQLSFKTTKPKQDGDQGCRADP